MSKHTHAPKPSHSTATRYTEAQKIQAVTILRTYDDSTSVEAIAAVHAAMGPIASTTLFRWSNQYGEQVKALAKDRATRPALDAAAIVKDTRAQVISYMQSGILNLSQNLADPTQIQTAGYRDKGVVFGILHDKLKATISLRPDLEAVARLLDNYCEHIGLDSVQVIKDVLDNLKAQEMARNDVIIVTPDIETGGSG